MLSFKQYLHQPAKDRRSPKSKTRPQQASLREAKSPERSELRLMNRWELIRLIAEGPIEMVEVAIEAEGIFFQFVEIED
jgi:hypothetical protein